MIYGGWEIFKGYTFSRAGEYLLARKLGTVNIWGPPTIHIEQQEKYLGKIGTGEYLGARNLGTGNI